MMTKICMNCGKVFTPIRNHYAVACPKCTATYSQKKRRREYKKEIFEILGGKCTICGYVGLALQVDHVNGHGKEQINNLRKNHASTYYWKHVWEHVKDGSKDYQLLCANCNWEKEFERRNHTHLEKVDDKETKNVD